MVRVRAKREGRDVTNVFAAGLSGIGPSVSLKPTPGPFERSLGRGSRSTQEGGDQHGQEQQKRQQR